MKKYNLYRGIMAMIGSVVMIVGQLPVSAAVADIPNGGKTISFEALSEATANQLVSLGTDLEDLDLPDTLSATIRVATTRNADEQKETVQDSGESVQEEQIPSVSVNSEATTSSAVQLEESVVAANTLPMLTASGGSSIWNGGMDKSWYSGNESADSYTITTAEQLAGLAALVNGGNDFSDKTIKLDADIVLNDVSNVSEWATKPPSNIWMPIGTSGRIVFSGTFDGRGHTVSGIYIISNGYHGLFGSTGNGSTVENVGVTDSYIIGDRSVGGVVGHSRGTVENCYNTGSVASDDFVGGVVGYNDGDIVRNCYNTGSVQGNNAVGGVVGNNNENGNEKTGKVENCYNTGSVEGIGSQYESSENVGGVIGLNYYSCTAQNCYNRGSVTGGKAVGGVVGDNNAGATTQNCYNTGSVEGIPTTYDNSENVGGVIGYNKSGTAKNCYNTGSVEGIGITSYSSKNVGGVIGYNENGTAKNCYNTGSVTGENAVGGMVGSMFGYKDGNEIQHGTAQNCYNTGSVSGTGENVGSVVGENKNSSGAVTSCYYDKTTCGEIGGIDGSDAEDQAEGKGTPWMKNATNTAGAGEDNSTFDGWDGENIWIFETENYPQLRNMPETSGGGSDEEAPTVGSVTPSGTDADLAGSIAITFSEAMDTSAGTVELDNSVGTLSSGEWSGENKVYTVSYSELAYATTYTITISGFKDTDGNEMAVDSGHTFTTAAPPVDVFDYANAPERGAFYLRVETKSDSTDFQIPVCGSTSSLTYGISYDWSVDWGDDNSSTYSGESSSTGGIPHTFDKAGIYTIIITPNGAASNGWFRAFGFGDNSSVNINANKQMLTGFAGVFDDTALDFGNTESNNFIANNMFHTCKNLIAANIIFDTNVTDVGDGFASNMFYYCEALSSLPESFNLPGSITSVGDDFADGMFYWCKALTSLPDDFNLPGSITSVGNEFAKGMFTACRALTSLPENFNLPGSITSVGNEFAKGMFTACDALTSLPDDFNLPGSITTAGDFFASNMFYGCTALTSLPDDFNLPGSITTAGDFFASNMFDSCTSLTTLPNGFNLPGGIMMAGDNFVSCMFFWCKALTSLPDDFNLPGSITTAGDLFASNMFDSCTSLTTLPNGFNLPGGITMAGDGFASDMFHGCTALTSLPDDFNLPSSITTAGDFFASSMFVSCTKLKINSAFQFPRLSQEQLNQEYMFANTFDDIETKQDKGAAAWILSNLADNTAEEVYTKIYPNEDSNTFSEAFNNDKSWNAIHANWKVTDSTYTPSLSVTDVALTSDGDSAEAEGSLVITFSEAMSTKAGTVKLTDGAATVTLNGGTWSEDGSVYTVAYSDLAYGTEYTVLISDFKSASDGTMMDADDSHTFTTKTDDSALTGTATIAGDAVYGEELTASLTDGNNTGDLSYQWVRDGEDINGATDPTYTLGKDDIGAVIAVKITSSDKNGTQTSTSTDIVTKADCEESTTTPVLSNKTNNSITVTVVDGYEYLIIVSGEDISSGIWQDSNTFKDLSDGKQYVIYQRIKATDTHNASSLSEALTVTTKITVPYNWNYGTAGTYIIQAVSAGGKTTGPETPQRAGYTFGGWYQESGCTNAWNFNSDTVNGSTTLFAKWIEKTSKTLEVTYNNDGAESGSVPIDHTEYVLNNTVTVKGNTGSLARSGYSFAGWSDGTKTYTAGDTFTIIDNTLLTAVWTENATQYTVTYSNNYTGGGNYTTQTVKYGALLSKPAVPTRAGYTFVAWYKNAGCTKPWNFNLDTVTGDTMLYTKWVKETYSVSGTVQDDAVPLPNKVEDAVVKVMQGNVQFGNTVLTDVEGKFTVTGIPNGEYNIVIAKEGHTVTLHIRVDGSDFTYGGQITLPSGNKNSKLDIIGADTPNIVENGLHDLFNDVDIYDQDSEDAVTNGGTVEIRLAVQKDDSSQEKGTLTAQMSSAGYKAGVVLNIGIEKTITSNSGAILDQSSITALDDTLTLIIPLPDTLQGKNNYVVYRTHDYGGTTGVKVDKIKTSKNADNEYIEVSADKTYLTLHAKFFSTYAIGYTDSSSGGNTGGHSSGRSSRTHSFTITAVTGAGGSSSPSGNVSIVKGTDKTFAFTPKEGYQISDVLIDGKSIGAVTSYTFTNVDSAHTISVIFAKVEGLPYYLSSKGSKVFIGFASSISGTMKYIAPEGETILFEENPKEFTDIANHWAKSYIDFVTQREIFVGTGTTTFSPNTGMTRAMFATVIGRLYERSYGALKTYGAHDFTDCDYDGWYGPYVGWCSKNGIIEGVGGRLYEPNREITRQEMAVILHRFEEFLKVSEEKTEGTQLAYPDSDEIDSWAREAALYCQTTGIITGRNNGNFVPGGTATRAEVSTILKRFIEITLQQ